MREKGDKVATNVDDNSVEFILKPETFITPEGMIEEFKAPEPKYKVKSRYIQGNQEAPHTIKIEYCGGWGFRRKVDAAIGAIEHHHKDQFRYILYKDEGTTGRFEWTVYKDSNDDTGNNGVLIHSRLRTKTFVHEDYESFLDLVSESIGKLWTQTMEI